MQQAKSWIKHFDFMVIDLVCMQLCFTLSYWVTNEFGNPYESYYTQYQAFLILASQLVLMLFTNSYQGIIRRGRLEEAWAVLKFAILTFILVVVYLFLVHQSFYASRLLVGFTFTFFVVLDFVMRELNKARIFRLGKARQKSLVLITSSKLADQVMRKLTDPNAYHDYAVHSVILLDAEDVPSGKDYGVPVVRLSRESIGAVSHGWVDEVFIMQPESIALPTRLLDDLLEMGMTVSYASEAMSDDRWPATDMKKIDGYRVITSSLRLSSAGQLALKRALDIVGGLIGCLLTGILFVFVAPAIYAKSPGPIFFRQERVGRNGKVFKMYKFRSMYLDAEERKAALADQNKMDGLMFKVDDDPRIIGSEKKDAQGNPKGIGNFIRNTSIDEFPQFINVLKGDMSLVGTRPPTLDEWERYDLEHRVRMSIKPGITGLWQVSGRSQITDFDEVVRLDRDYVERWNIGLDLRILAKTVIVVLRRRGAE